MSEIAEEFQEVNGQLRVIARLQPASWDIEYMRDDLEDEYEESDLDQAYRSIMGSQVSADDFSKVGAFGDFLAQQYFFEEVIVFQFPSSRYEGLFVSYDLDDDFPVNEAINKADEVSELL